MLEIEPHAAGTWFSQSLARDFPALGKLDFSDGVHLHLFTTRRFARPWRRQRRRSPCAKETGEHVMRVNKKEVVALSIADFPDIHGCRY